MQEVTVITKIEVSEYGHVAVERVVRAVRDDGTIAVQSEPHRHVLAPGDPLEGQDARVAAVAAAVWTPEVLTQYRALVALSAEEDPA